MSQRNLESGLRHHQTQYQLGAMPTDSSPSPLK